MRGALPKDRQRKIESSFPRAIQRLEMSYPTWAVPFLASEARTAFALRELWDGWHLLCEANLALIESEACWAWYSEFRSPPSETLAKYFCVYFLEDAALRLGASSGHMVSALKAHMNFKFLKKGKRPAPLTRAVMALEAIQPRPRVLAWLQALERNKDWQACSDYRNKWTHNSRPAIAGLGTILTSRRLETTGDCVGFGFGTEQPVDWTVEELRPIFGKSYAALLGAYLKVILSMSPSRKALLAVKPILAPAAKRSA